MRIFEITKMVSYRLAVVAFVFVALAGAMYVSGVTINKTESTPVGVYLEVPGTPKRGDYVKYLYQRTADYPEYGAFRDGQALIKIVVGRPGDLVVVSGSDVWVCYPEADDCFGPIKRKQRTLSGLTIHPLLEDGLYLLDEGEYFLYAPHKDSFDSRYYGFVPADRIKRVIPLVTTGEVRLSSIPRE